MVMTYEIAIDFFRNKWGIAIRDARKLLNDCRNGKPVMTGNGPVYYRSDKKYELIDE